MRGLYDIVGRIAARQHGVISREQLYAAGVDARRAERWLAGGRLRRVHKGVYAVGYVARTLAAVQMAAVLACGDDAVLSHRAAAHLYGLERGAPPPPEVTVPTTAGRARPGIAIHRVRHLQELDLARYDGIPVTTVPRVLLDVAAAYGPERLTRACHQAWVRHRTGPREIEACIARNPRKPGIAKLRAALGSDVTLSDLEDAFLVLLARHGLPAPRTNIDRTGDKVDCHWPQHGLTIELVSYRYHATRRGFEQDVARRRRSSHIAYSWGDVFERPAATVADLRPRLRHGP